MRKLQPSQLCASNFSYYRFPFETFLEDAVSLGFEAIEIWGIAPHLHVGQVDSADLRAISRELATRKLKLACFTPEQILYPVNIASEEPWLREDSIRFFKRAVEICAELECPYLFLTSGAGYQNRDREEAWKRSAASLAEIVDYAQAKGVIGVLEALQPRESNLVLSIPDLARMLAEVGSPALKVALDTVAMAVAGETPAHYFAEFGNDVRHCHFIDGMPAGHLAWGDGALPMAQYLQELAEADYGGMLSLEFNAARYALEPSQPLRQCAEAIRDAIA